MYIFGWSWNSQVEQLLISKRLVFGINSAPKFFFKYISGYPRVSGNYLNYVDDTVFMKTENEHGCIEINANSVVGISRGYINIKISKGGQP